MIISFNKILIRAFFLAILILTIPSCKTNYYDYESICMDNPTSDTLIVIIDQKYGFRIDPLMTIVNFQLPKDTHIAEVYSTSRSLIKKVNFSLYENYSTDLFINIAGEEYVEWQVLFTENPPDYIKTKSTTITIDNINYVGDLTYVSGTRDTFRLFSYSVDIESNNCLPFKSLPEASEVSAIKKLYRKRDFINDWNYRQIDTTNETGKLLFTQREKLITFYNALQKFKTSYKNILEDSNSNMLIEFQSTQVLIQTYLPQWEREKEKMDVAALLKIFAEHENYFISKPLLKDDYNNMKITGEDYIQFNNSLPDNISQRKIHSNGRVIEYEHGPQYKLELLSPKFEYTFENGKLKSKDEYISWGTFTKKKNYLFPIELIKQQ